MWYIAYCIYVSNMMYFPYKTILKSFLIHVWCIGFPLINIFLKKQECFLFCLVTKLLTVLCSFRWPSGGVVRGNIGELTEFGFWIDKEYFKNDKYTPNVAWDILVLKLFIVYLKFKINRVPCILFAESGDLIFLAQPRAAPTWMASSLFAPFLGPCLRQRKRFL